MERLLKEAFDGLEAEESLKNETRQAVIQAMRSGRGAKRRSRRWLPVLAMAACCLLALGVGCHQLYFTPTTVLSIDINPSLEMDINRFDRVISINGYNDDGVALAEELNVKNRSYSDAVDALMANDTISDCLARGEELSIAVVQAEDGDTSQSDAVLTYVSGCTAGHANAHCYALETDAGQMNDAHAAGLSCGKYHAYQELLAYDPDLTAAEVQQMTMREIRELLAQYQGGDAADDSGSAGGNGQGNGQGAGSGEGNGASGSGSGQGYGASGSGSGQGYGVSGSGNGQGHGSHHGSGHE